MVDYLVNIFRQNTPNKKFFNAVHGGNVAEVQKALADDADINGIKHGETALHIAARNGDVAMLRELIHAGANLELQDGSGKRPWEIALDEEHLDAFKILGVATAAEHGVDDSASRDLLHQPNSAAAAVANCARHGLSGMDRFFLDMADGNVPTAKEMGLNMEIREAALERLRNKGGMVKSQQ